MADEKHTTAAVTAPAPKTKDAKPPQPSGQTRHEKDVKEHEAYKTRKEQQKKDQESNKGKVKDEDKPLFEHQKLDMLVPTNPVYEDVERGKLGDNGPSSDEKGINQGNFREEEDQHPSMNATAGGPDVGTTPANAPGLSHA